MSLIDSLDTKSLGTVVQGTGGVLLSLWEVLPDLLRILILVATLIHILVRIIKDAR